MATYYITGIKQSTVGQHTFISIVLLLVVSDAGVHTGVLKGKEEVIRLIKQGHHIFSATWNYSDIRWTQQETVSYETVGGQEYLRTTPDATKRDNLLHLLPLANLGL